MSNKTQKNKIELKFISNKNNLSIYNKSLSKAGYINTCVGIYMIFRFVMTV